jgi:hypothetical protein
VINLSFSLYNDNVEEDVLVPRVTSYQGAIDYAFNKFPHFPMGIGYQQSKLDSSMEPALTLPLETETDIISGRINYVEGKWNVGLQASYSEENDRTDTGNDSTAATYSFSPTYYSQHFSVYPNFSFNSTHFAFSDIRTDTYTASLDIRGDFLQGKFTYGIAGTFNRIEANDKSIDLDTTSATARVDYLLGSNIMGFFNPSVGLRGLLNTTDDRVFVEKRDELAILLVLSNYSSFSF